MRVRLKEQKLPDGSNLFNLELREDAERSGSLLAVLHCCNLDDARKLQRMLVDCCVDFPVADRKNEGGGVPW